MFVRSFNVQARFVRRRRLFSTSTTAPLKPTHSIYLSDSTNPLFNLSLEDWLFRHAPTEDPLLLIYRDDPCVVIGRNQNPWKEVNMAALKRTGIPFVRRRSGGGTVYHDLGNTNFSIHLPRAAFDRHATAQVALRAVRSLDIDARVNDRNDICVGSDKVSGSAYKIVNRRAYHHGTMLISTQLDTLGDLLRSDKDTMITKGVASVRSPVCNLRRFSATVNHDAFTKAVIDAFREEYGIHEQTCVVSENEDTKGIEYIRAGMAELPSWEWAYGQTPEFVYTLQHAFEWGDLTAEIRSKHGIILSCAFKYANGEDATSTGLGAVRKALEGQRYGFMQDYSESGVPVAQEPAKDVWNWLVESTQF
ncbi:hypothetical protein PLICRDRAFT_33404 [Plicaturopsis crispa FD-325 SS-3]|nr:hypothetical protein PLICRDRAFT_33404 [Plicaturopsis crispa FD-325 SS-3]